MTVKSKFVIAILVLASFSMARVSLAQDDKKEEPAAEETKADQGQADDTKEGDDAKEDEPAKEAGPAMKEYREIMVSWTALLKDLRTYQLQYKTANAEEKTKIVEQFNKRLEDGKALEPKIAQAAEAAFKEDPSADKEVGELLTAFTEKYINEDRYEDALRSSMLLIEGNFKNNKLPEYAGIASFVLGDYDAAGEYFSKAESAAALSTDARRYQALVPAYKKKWEREKKLREEEATADDLPRVLFKTSKGDITIELFENEAPNTVANFISLIEGQKYDNTVFHRVLPHFMAQGGDPKGTGEGGPGYTIDCECVNDNHREHFRGSLSMAHAGPNTGGSQFFITFVPTDHLNGRHTVFGRVIDGWDVLAKLQRIDPMQDNTAVPDKIEAATVIRKRDHEYKPETHPDGRPGKGQEEK